MKDVIVYTSNTCPYCTMAKEYLTEKGVNYIEKNVNEDPEARRELIQKGYRGVPVIIIGGEEIPGFDKERIDSLL
ncbi:glutaredoxin family protein [Thermohalobacter berrensis]|uniref:NrdH-redoxin n=1 Tax=Thermohalobacter berrensis TaxID=99594 RepID=A0A419T1J6_9FIRM|nr:glutaredoxin family protein [Thermohalobacter berrensis]RKD31332.1 NrdH-redoxin [Thermohalobacter berrensis]